MGSLRIELSRVVLQTTVPTMQTHCPFFVVHLVQKTVAPVPLNFLMCSTRTCISSFLPKFGQGRELRYPATSFQNLDAASTLSPEYYKTQAAARRNKGFTQIPNNFICCCTLNIFNGTESLPIAKGFTCLTLATFYKI